MSIKGKRVVYTEVTGGQHVELLKYFWYTVAKMSDLVRRLAPLATL